VSRIRIVVTGRTAVLKGEVRSKGERELAGILLSFEPGISVIENELVVTPRLHEMPDSLQSLRNRQTPQSEWITLSHGSRDSKLASGDR